MTVQELIDELKKHNPEAAVTFSVELPESEDPCERRFAENGWQFVVSNGSPRFGRCDATVVTIGVLVGESNLTQPKVVKPTKKVVSNRVEEKTSKASGLGNSPVTSNDDIRKSLIVSHPELCIGQEVHVVGWGTGPFFTVRQIESGKAHLSTRYRKEIKYIVPIERCYLTHRSCQRVCSRLP